MRLKHFFTALFSLLIFCSNAQIKISALQRYTGSLGNTHWVPLADSGSNITYKYKLKDLIFDSTSISNRINQKLSLGDTSNMLQNYFKNGGNTFGNATIGTNGNLSFIVNGSSFGTFDGVNNNVYLGNNVAAYTGSTNNNICIGNSTFFNASGDFNIFLGYNGTHNTGSYVTALGHAAGNNNNYNHVVLLGFNAKASSANQFVFGSSSGNVRISNSHFAADRLHKFPDANGTYALGVKFNGTTYNANDSGLVNLGTFSGGVTQVSVTNGLGITSSVANATTIPNITTGVDTANTNILSRQRAAATYATIANVALKANISDTASMLSNYLRSNVAAATYATIANLALKANISDTASMLSNYLRSNVAASTYLPLTGGTLTGTGGSGFVGYRLQSIRPSIPSTGFRLFADSLGRFGWLGSNGFTRVFDGTANTADRTYTLPNTSGTVALISDVPTVSGTANYIPKFTAGSVIGNSGILEAVSGITISNTATATGAGQTVYGIDFTSGFASGGFGGLTNGGYRFNNRIFVNGSFIECSGGQSLFYGSNLLTGGTGVTNGTILIGSLGTNQQQGIASSYGGGTNKLSAFLQTNAGTTTRFHVNIGGTEMFTFNGNAELLINTTTSTGDKLNCNGSVRATQFKLSALNTAPSSSSDTGTTGEIRIVNGFIYVCVSTNTWQRTTLSTF